jgi:hypothetical protein
MPRAVALLAALAALGGACFAVLVANAVNWLACENEGSEACERQDLASTQLVVAIAGLAPAIVLVVAAARGNRRITALALVVGVPLYLGWAILVDAAVHGWDDLTLVP